LEVNRVESTILPGDERKIAAALGMFEHNVEIKDLQQRIAVHQSERLTPLMFEYQLIQRAKSERKRIVLAGGWRRAHPARRRDPDAARRRRSGAARQSGQDQATRR
jgi:hypothetical protein